MLPFFVLDPDIEPLQGERPACELGAVRAAESQVLERVMIRYDPNLCTAQPDFKTPQCPDDGVCLLFNSRPAGLSGTKVFAQKSDWLLTAFAVTLSKAGSHRIVRSIGCEHELPTRVRCMK